ncbi:MAG: hypothetical protein KDD66_04460 [Bdellovibrionales bacterium]|nr:hypothetical protein [Bdellovibrionales bacterium]
MNEIHLSDSAVYEFVCSPVAPYKARRHLQTGCDFCQARVVDRFNRALEVIDNGGLPPLGLRVDFWLKRLRGRYSARYCCPKTLADDLAAHKPGAALHLKYCQLCRQDMDDRGSLVRNSPGTD